MFIQVHQVRIFEYVLKSLQLEMRSLDNHTNLHETIRKIKTNSMSWYWCCRVFSKSETATATFILTVMKEIVTPRQKSSSWWEDKSYKRWRSGPNRDLSSTSQK